MGYGDISGWEGDFNSSNLNVLPQNYYSDIYPKLLKIKKIRGEVATNFQNIAKHSQALGNLGQLIDQKTLDPQKIDNIATLGNSLHEFISGRGSNRDFLSIVFGEKAKSLENWEAKLDQISKKTTT